MQCNGDISHAFKTANISVFDPMMCKVHMHPYKRAANINQPTENQPAFNTCMDGKTNSSWVHITYTTNDHHSKITVIMPFKVIQGHQFWYQSKVHYATSY